MTKLAGLAVVFVGMSTALLAGVNAVAAPEIDGPTGVAAATLLVGAAVVLRGRRKK